MKKLILLIYHLEKIQGKKLMYYSYKIQSKQFLNRVVRDDDTQHLPEKQDLSVWFMKASILLTTAIAIGKLHRSWKSAQNCEAL